MKKPHPTRYTDDNQFCSVDEAAAKLLGWMRSTSRLHKVKVPRTGYRTEELPHLPHLEAPLLDTLQSFCDWAEEDLRAATDATKSEEARQRLARWQEQHRHASYFLADIRRELTKVKKPALQIDQSATNVSGETHLTLDSLDQWARHNYNVSVRADCAVPAVPRECRLEKEIPADKGLSRTVAEGLQITFALLVEEYAGPKSGYQRPDGTPNVDAIGRHLASRAKKATQGGPTSGQSKEAIKGRIEEALSLKHENFKSAHDGRAVTSPAIQIGGNHRRRPRSE